jgi:hypothetical protein
MGVTSANRREFFFVFSFLSPVALNMQPKLLVLEVQKITNFLELTFFLDLAGCALGPIRGVNYLQYDVSYYS